MALARFSSAFSRFNRFSSADSSDVIPGRRPASTSAWRHHFRTVSGVPTPSSSATLLIAAHSDSWSARISPTIRTARSRSSAGYLVDLLPDMTPTFPTNGVSGLAGAVQDGVFSEIRYESVFDLVNPDEAIAEAALKILRDDLDAGLDHILMARCDTQKRADDVHRIYREKAPEFAPVVIHSGMTTRQRAGAMEEVTSRRSRAVVCVDMLGEGFDLPQLKIAAIHDPRRTLGPTLQFVGRFARVAAGTGTAAMVAARSEKSQDNRLSRLYTEDADWNRLVSELSYGSILEQQAVTEFEEGFGDPESRAATRTIAPKMSAVVFETSCEEWDPAAITDVIPASDILTTPLPVNHAANVVWFVRRSRQDVPWVDSPGVEDVVHDLFVLHWDRETQLLYINHSANDGVNADLAAAVTGGTSSLIDGERVYRAMGEMQRAVPTNVGVLDIYSRSRRFAMYAGANVHDGLEPTEEATKVQTNVFVSGFRDGDRATVGVSLKGRIWSYLAARNLLDWIEWCKDTGRRLQDDAIDVAEIKRNFIKPVVLTAWPEGSTVLAADWATDTLLHPAQSLVGPIRCTRSTDSRREPRDPARPNDNRQSGRRCRIR